MSESETEQFIPLDQISDNEEGSLEQQKHEKVVELLRIVIVKTE